MCVIQVTDYQELPPVNMRSDNKFAWFRHSEIAWAKVKKRKQEQGQVNCVWLESPHRQLLPCFSFTKDRRSGEKAVHWLEVSKRDWRQPIQCRLLSRVGDRVTMQLHASTYALSSARRDTRQEIGSRFRSVQLHASTYALSSARRDTRQEKGSRFRSVSDWQFA